MDYPISPHAHAVAVGEDVVFLDLRSGTYLCLPGARTPLALAPDRRSLRLGDRGVARTLAAAGLLAETPAAPALGRRPPPGPRRSAVAGNVPPPAWRDLGEAAACVADVALTYPGRPLVRLLRAARAGPSPPPASPGWAEMLAVVSRVQRWLPYAPVPGKCLLRSYMLLRRLRRAGLDADWVFGVRTYPFAAHCWLQAGEVALDDEHERLVPFQPIMAA